MIDIEVMQDASEIIHYDNPYVPYAIQDRQLSSYTDMRALCHWHDDLEWIYIFDGEMNYDVNGRTYLLQKGDIIFVNTRQLHFGYENDWRDCHFLVVLFHPELLKANPHLYQRYVYPILDFSLDAIHFTKNQPAAKLLGEILQEIHACHQNIKTTYELELVSIFYRLWGVLYQNCNTEEYIAPAKEDPDIQLQKNMISYIYQHYQEPIQLQDIAAAGTVSRSKCCKIFQKFQQQSPISFLSEYRMETSCHLLCNTDYSVTQIAISCGYNHLSYFSKMFLKKYGCSPHDYRKLHNMAS